MLTPETMHREFIGAYNRRDFAAMKTLLDEDYVYVSGDGKAARGIEAGLQNAYLYATAFPDAVIEVARVFQFGNTAVAELVARGTHLGNLHGMPPTKKKVEIVMCNVMELRDGKIHREREYFDGAGSKTSNVHTASITTQSSRTRRWTSTELACGS